LEACPLTESDLLSMDFVINRFLNEIIQKVILIVSNKIIVKNVFHSICQAICVENE